MVLLKGKFLGDFWCEPTSQSCVDMAWSADFTNKLCYRLKTLGAPKATENCLHIM